MPLQIHFFFASLRLCVFALTFFCLSACELHFGALPTPTPSPTATPMPELIIVYVKAGDLYAWQENTAQITKIASTGVIQPFLAPDGKHVAFTRGQQGDKNSLWMVGIDGIGETQLARPQDLRAIRDGHPQIYQVAWLSAQASDQASDQTSDQAVYFNTYQKVASGSIQSDDLYRAAPGSNPQLILPAGAGGDFAISPDGEHIAVVRAGIYDTQKGQVALLDPLGAKVDDKLTFTALRPPDQAPFYLPLAWGADSSFVRVPVPNPDNDRVALWRVPVEGDAKIFGYISALSDGLPAWTESQMVYTRASSQPGMSDLILADADGENERVYDTGKLTHPYWLPDGTTFAYDKDGATFLGTRGTAPTRTDADHQRFLAHGFYVFATGNQLSYTYMTGNAPIITINPPIPADVLFDAVVTP